ncbi:MAG TPA: hypothetical protein VEA61_12375 [Allosphingosinicella sp.]|nr:hypothetical protein [Allosphingosinicella sp.]
MRMVNMSAGLALLLAGAAPGLAAPKKDGPDYDPNREICKNQAVLGSRLKRVRTCMTAQQWEDIKLQERVGLMRKQYNGSPGAGGAVDDRIN